MEKEKEENIWRRKIYFLGGGGKGGKYLECFEEEKNKSKVESQIR